MSKLRLLEKKPGSVASRRPRAAHKPSKKLGPKVVARLMGGPYDGTVIGVHDRSCTMPLQVGDWSGQYVGDGSVMVWRSHGTTA